MKKLYTLHFFFVLLFLSTSVSAQQQIVLTSIAQKDTSYLNINKQDLTKNFLSEAGSQTIDIETNLVLQSKSDQDWYKISIEDDKIIINVEKNDAAKERKAESLILFKYIRNK